MYFTYILYSASRNKYYVGACEDISNRLIKHNTNHSGFTGKTGDWIIKWIEQHTLKAEALRREKQIKGWKSRKMIEKLISETSS
jgi:putative endonuclease